MFCSSCGTQNPDSAAFCKKCGSALGGGMAAPAYQATQQQWAQAGRPAARPAVEGNIGAAWRDITGSDGWFKKVFILLLIGCVPILNLAVEGYGIRWARELSFGQRAGLPDTVFKRKEISTGFFAWLIRFGLTFAYLLVVAVVTLLLSGVIALFNAGAAMVVAIIFLVLFGLFYLFFYGPMVDASIVRMSVVGYLESGFNVTVAWQAFRRNMGGLIGASIVPRLAVGVVQIVVIALISLVGGLILGASAYGMALNNPVALMGAAGNPQSLIGAFTGLGLGYIFIQLLTTIVSSMCNVFSMLFAFRSVGHWVARTVPEWSSEADDGLDSGNTGGFGFNTLIPDAPVQPPLPYAGAPAPQPTQRQQWNGPIDKGDSGTTRLDAGAPQFALVRKSNGQTYEVVDFPATVGKGSAATVRIEDNNAISRTHVRIAYTGSSFVVEELGATNRTYLNGDYLSDGEIVLLKDGDELKLAEEAFTVRIR